jgi:hypothetical protein
VVITYRFGEDAGQGFLHGFAGLLLFTVAIVLLSLVDRVADRVLPAAWR